MWKLPVPKATVSFQTAVGDASRNGAKATPSTAAPVPAAARVLRFDARSAINTSSAGTAANANCLNRMATASAAAAGQPERCHDGQHAGRVSVAEPGEAECDGVARERRSHGQPAAERPREEQRRGHQEQG